MAHGQLGVMVCKAALRLVGPPAHTGAWGYSSPGVDLALALVELHEILVHFSSLLRSL